MITNKKHLLFADLYKLTDGITGDDVRCYQKVYPNAKYHSAQTKSGELLKNVEIKNYIQEYKDKIRIDRENNITKLIKAQDNSNILAREKVVEMTSNVVEMTYIKVVNDKAEDKEYVKSFLGAVNLYSELEGLKKPTKVANTDTNGNDIPKDKLLDNETALKLKDALNTYSSKYLG